MAIAVKVNDKVENGLPKLMISKTNELLVIANSINGSTFSGMCINEDKYSESGKFSNSWQLENFTEYNGEITLKNK